MVQGPLEKTSNMVSIKNPQQDSPEVPKELTQVVYTQQLFNGLPESIRKYLSTVASPQPVPQSIQKSIDRIVRAH